METLTLSDGTVFAGHCFESDGVLWVYINDSTLTEVFTHWNDPAKTNSIVFDNYGTKITFTGYNHMYFVREEDGTLVTTGLKKQ